MQNLDSYKPRSISRTLSAGLIMTLVLVAGLSLGVNFVLASRKAKAELETRVEEYISALTDALKVPLWNYSEETIEAICTSYAQNELVARLLVEDQKGAVLFKKEKVDQRLVVSRSSDIFYEGNLIGRVHIALASGYYTAFNRQLFQSFGLTIVIMIGTLLVMTGVLLRQFLKKPMSRFSKMVDAYAAGESDAFKQGILYSEFSPLVDVLDAMGEKIATQMRSIRKLNEDLERRVEVRTAELRKLSEAIGQSPVTVMITDKNGTIEYVNPKFSEVSGYSAEEAIGQNPRILKSGNHPDSFYKDLWDIILSGRTWRGEFYNSKKNGEEFWESTSISAIKNDEGEITHFVAVKQDITDRKQAELSIMESRAKYRDLVENANFIIFQMDTRGKITFFNRFAQDFFGYSEAEILGRSVVGTIAPATDSTGRNVEIMIQDLVKHPEKYTDNENENIRRNGDPHLLARLVAGLFDGREDHIDRRGVVGEIRCKAAFVANRRAEPLVVEHLLERVEDFAATADRVAKPLDAQRHDHELLHVDRVVGMLAAVDDVHHRGGQEPSVRAADIAIERQADILGRRVGRGQRNAKDRIRTQLLLVRCAVELAEHAVDADLIQRVGPDQLVGDLFVDVGDRLQDAFAKEDLLVAVAELPGLVDAGARTARHGGRADRAVVERDVDLDGGIAAAIKNLASVDVNNHAHGNS